MRNYPFKTIVACLSILWHSPHLWAADAVTPDTAVLDTIEVRGKRLTKDQKGEAQQYSKNVSNAYLGKEYLERYRPDAAGDILKGLNGVYNMNTRTAGSAITPNIRGISGKGRIPVTIDGIEQTVDVWQNNYGISDRNYIDPTLLRSISVEKGPSMTRGVKSGVGGSVAIQTIEPEDIVPEGKKWGIQIKGSFSDNTVKQPESLLKYKGWPDYRTLPGNPTADGAIGTIGNVLEDPSGQSRYYYGLQFEDRYRITRFRNHKLRNFKNDRSGMFSAAFKTDISDGLIAYSIREKGNYFAGKHAAGGYLNNPVYKNEDSGHTNTTASMVPNMARFYRPGREVVNSNISSKSLLLKNNWHLPANQKISLSYMQTRVDFGEHNPFYSNLAQGYSDDFFNIGEQYREAAMQMMPIQGMESNIQNKSYKIGYGWKPENNSWIDLNANIWRTRTRSTRYQNGATDLYVDYPDSNYDNWIRCSRGEIPWTMAFHNMNCSQMMAEGLIPDKEPSKKPYDGDPKLDGYRVKAAAEQRTRSVRTGADLSNRFRLGDTLSMTLSANVQHEKLNEFTEQYNNDLDFDGLSNAASGMTALSGPRSGRRHEWGAGMVFDWQPTDRLNIQAGIRYNKFWSYDDILAQKRKERKESFYSITKGNEGYIIGTYLPYYKLIDNPQEVADYFAYDNAPTGSDEQEKLGQKFEKKYGYLFSSSNNILRNPKGNPAYDTGEPQALYRLEQAYTPFRNGRFEGPVFPDGMFDEKIANPQGQNGNFYKYLIQRHTDTAATTDYEDKKKNYPIEAGDMIKETKNLAADSDENWPSPKHLRAHAWSPMLALSYDLTQNGRLHLRWAQAVRFPTIYEATTTNSSWADAYSQEFDLKPERSTNWEIGYTYNFAPRFKRLRHGDIRLTYYNSVIKNAIELSSERNLQQYDKRLTSGIELQSRFDSGKWFASLAANYRLKQQTCDKATVFNYDLYINRIPVCVDGGFGATRFHQSRQPKYSINLDIGTRRFNEKLELGLRGTYHSKAENKQQDKLAKSGLARIYEATGRPYHWRSALVLDVYGRYNFGKNLSMNFSVSNLTNRYYLDPMSNVPIPAPGRAVTVGFTGKF